MSWYIDTHKFFSERTRILLQILRDHKINRASSNAEISKAEAEMDARGLYGGARGAKGRIRRALFTYFQAFSCMDEDGNLTSLGRLFANGDISLKEFAFHYIANYFVEDGDSHYYPLHLILLFLKKVSLISPSDAFLSATDFKRLQSFNAISELDDAFLASYLATNRFTVTNEEYRSILFDCWKNLLISAGLFKVENKASGEVLKFSAGQFIYEWLLYAYSQSPISQKGEINTGVFYHLPFNGYDSIVGQSLRIRNNSFLSPQPWDLSGIGSASQQEAPKSLPFFEKLLEDSNLRQFALKVVRECYKEDKLSSMMALKTDSSISSKSTVYNCIGFSSVSMSTVFLNETEATMDYLNTHDKVARWHDFPFIVDSKTLFLTTQWRDLEDASSSTFPTFNKLKRLVEQAYDGIFELKRTEMVSRTGTKSVLYQLFRLDEKQPVIEIPNEMKNFITALKTKPFLLLAGISGTGKSRKVKELAYMTCPDKDGLRNDDSTPGNYCLVEVKPNWHDSTELLGYYSTLSGKYELTPFIRFVFKAWMNPGVPFFVCLDEMNLAPVEQYFAEFLSTLETRSIGLDNSVITASMLDAVQFSSYSLLDRNGGELYSPSDKEVIVFIQQNGLRLPDNLFVIGTVNMDDTTHQFSRKVIDRAFTIEMNGDSLSSMFDTESASALKWHDPVISFDMFKPEFVKAVDVLEDPRFAGYVDDIKSNVPSILDDFNTILKNTPFRVSFRVQNEFVLYLSSVILENEDIKKDEAINTSALIILLEKILPRIQGDNKLLKTSVNSNVLKDLKEYVISNFSSLSSPDVYQEVVSKLDEMNNKLETTYFANFF